MTLTTSDKHHWAPIPQVVDWLAKSLPPMARVLEVGPGHAPFPRANTYVDFVDPCDLPISNGDHVPEQAIRCDLATNPLPFPDKSFDFIYCRHMLEDMYNPFLVLSEMERVGKAGYIETPSPIAELCRGVDGGAPAYRGYHHHRFIAWEHACELRFVSKYPLVEYLQFNEPILERLLRSDAKYWNTYYLWKDKINFRHRQSPLDFDIPRDYQPMLASAVDQSKASTDEFFAQGIDHHQATIPNIKPAFA